jgi:hypothetical protein
MEPLIVDNFLPSMYIDSLYNLLTHQDTELQWHFAKFSSYREEPEEGTFNGLSFREAFRVKEPTKDHARCTHSFIVDDIALSEKYYKFVLPLVAQFENYMSTKVKKTNRIKANMLFNMEGVKLQPPHVDGQGIGEDGVVECVGKKSLLYYVNNSDGDTVFYNEKYTGQPLDYLTEKMRVSPKKGRAVIFDSNQVHAASIPTEKAYRVVINCIFTV